MVFHAVSTIRVNNVNGLFSADRMHVLERNLCKLGNNHGTLCGYYEYVDLKLRGWCMGCIDCSTYAPKLQQWMELS